MVASWAKSDEIKKLDPIGKSIIIDALQKLGLLCYPDRQALVLYLFTSSSGLKLHELKVVVDDGGDEHTLYKLLYTDLSVQNREQVLEYFRSDAAADRRKYRTKVLSDVDDTLYCSGGKKFGGLGGAIAGCDDRLGHHMYYPGVFAFYSELQRGDSMVGVPRGVKEEAHPAGPKNNSEVQPWVFSKLTTISANAHKRSYCDLVFLSAFPHIWGGLAEKLKYACVRYNPTRRVRDPTRCA